MGEKRNLTEVIIARTFRVPVPVLFEPGNSEALARQLDTALISVGFKASKQLLTYVSGLHPSLAAELSDSIIKSVRKIVGDHVQHNVYFKEFPKNVPDTLEFWASLLEDTLRGPNGPKVTAEIESGFLNLLSLDGYGKAQHTYEEMLEVQEDFISNIKDLKVLNVGETLPEEIHKLYLSLAGSKVPAVADDLDLLKRVAELMLDDEQPSEIPVRENKAIINAVRIKNDRDLLIDTTTDVLRIAAQLSDGDVTLQTKTKFKSLKRSQRRQLLHYLDKVVGLNQNKLSDVKQYSEQFKRLGERLHAFETLDYPNAQALFNVASGAAKFKSYNNKVESAFLRDDIITAIMLLSEKPGLYIRNLNRLLVNANPKEQKEVVRVLYNVIGEVATPVLLSLRQYVTSRNHNKDTRIFMNRKGTSYVVEDTQPVFGAGIIRDITELIDNEVRSRFPKATYVFQHDILNVALPLSNKSTTDGFNILPRGSVDTVSGEVLRFFTYWKEKRSTTDYDLSAVLLDENFGRVGQLSYTNLREVGGVHSGDITSAPNGASEFIDLELDKVTAKYIIPQVNLFSGESFSKVEESFFGYMERTYDQKGKPFEAQTVKTKSEMRGENKVALPLIFIKGDDGTWTVKWINTFLVGSPQFNAVENNTRGTSNVVRGLVEAEYLNVGYIADLLFNSENPTEIMDEEDDRSVLVDEDQTENQLIYVGRYLPEDLPEGAITISLSNLYELFS